MFSAKDLEKDKYTVKDMCRLLGVKPATIRVWARAGKFDFPKTAGGHRFLDRDGMIALLKQEGRLPADFVYNKPGRIDVLYCRVSSHDQKKHGDLDRQAGWLIQHVKGLKDPVVITDVGSGLNENRKGYQQLLDLVLRNEVAAVYVTYKDRLTRFGFKTLERVFASHGTSIIAVHTEENREAEKELMDDMMSLTASFSGKLYGMRSRKNRVKS